MNDSTIKQEIVDKIKGATNILVTVSDNPSVDALSAALGLTVALNNIDKHATAIFSGQVPPAITFLEPNKVFEATTDSLRDFIIALDKEKADHLRYKVEGDTVKIFITPYRTTITQNDLSFSQGDYNVELVIALGVNNQEHLDKSLEAHGRILHDAAVVAISADGQISKLGSINWHEDTASSLSEMTTLIVDDLSTDKKVLDKQISTAFLTGIVAETERFSNARTTSRSMTVAAKLMAAGADQQLIAAKLEESHTISPTTVMPEAVKAEVVPIEPAASLTALENAVQGLIVDHKPKTLEELSQEIKTQEAEDLAMTFPLVEQLPPMAPLMPEPLPAAQPISQPISQPIINPNPVIDTTPMAVEAPVAPSDGLFESRSYVSTSSSANPMNGAMMEEATIPDVDIFSQAPVGAQPTSPETLVGSPDAALAAVHAAFDEAATSVPVTPAVNLPMPPPLPDFSQLAPPSPMEIHPAYAPEPMPPLATPEQPATPNLDASQFRIPGQ